MREAAPSEERGPGVLAQLRTCSPSDSRLFWEIVIIIRLNERKPKGYSAQNEAWHSVLNARQL